MYSVYGTENETKNDDVMNLNQIIKHNNDPFDLSHKIYTSLQATINNIKSQLKIQEITGKNVWNLDGTNKNRLLDEDKNDD